MTDGNGSTAFQRFLTVITAMTLLGALGGGFVLVLRANRAPVAARVDFALGSGPGVVALRAVDDVGDRPFTEPVAVDLSIDPVKLVLPPLTAEAAESPHRRGSSADRIVAGYFGYRLVEMRDAGTPPTVRRIAELAEATIGIDGVVSDLLDADRDDMDDDGRFTVTALDGSAVCVTLGERRVLASAQDLAIDPVDRSPSNGLSWSYFGPCDRSSIRRTGADVRVGTTPGTYGGVRTGDVCDVPALVGALTTNAVVGAAWAAVHSIESTEVESFIADLTPVVLLRDTVVTDHGFDNGRIHPYQAVLEKGTAILVDQTGAPRVRCVSGSPLRRPQPLIESVTVIGEPWHGFAVDAVADVPAAPGVSSRFVLVDIRSGDPLIREAGAAGALSELAGPVLAVVAVAG
jgi:hypothetical protein